MLVEEQSAGVPIVGLHICLIVPKTRKHLHWGCTCPRPHKVHHLGEALQVRCVPGDARPMTWKARMPAEAPEIAHVILTRVRDARV